MWLCLNDAFLSIVSKDCARDELLVRARRKGDIEKVFPGATVSRNQRSDYLFRAVISRIAVRDAMARELDRITYSNFKDSVPKEERALHDAYLRVWSTMSALQPTRPYAGLPLNLSDIPETQDSFFRKAKFYPARAAGGRARMAKLTAQQRSENARNAANARWGKLAAKGD